MSQQLTLEQALAAMNPWAKGMLLAMARDFAREFPAEVARREPLRLTLVPQAREVDCATDVLDGEINHLPAVLVR